VSRPIARASSLAAVLRDKRLVVLVGEGGVGKTSTAAAIAYERACRGETVAVLTIDPAPRLGDALGIAEIDSQPRNVALPASCGGTGGSLTAMRLDSKHTFDRMVERHAPSPAAATALIAHPIYRAISEELGGSENYMAFQRLHELVETGGRDCLVLDTPPAANAAELLAAPARLTGLLETGALSILADPAGALLRAGRAASRAGGAMSRAGGAAAAAGGVAAAAGGMIARATLSVVLAAVERVTGASLQKEVSEFAELFSGLVGGLESRARDIDALLRSPETAFVLVTRPRGHDVADALAFRAGLARMGIRMAAVLVNRVTPQAARSGANMLHGVPAHLRPAIRRMEDDMNALRALEKQALAQLRTGLAETDDPPLFVLGARDLDIASLEDVAALAAEITG
jgi:anion-transporting  ArsA/GET3 family ATPase